MPTERNQQPTQGQPDQPVSGGALGEHPHTDEEMNETLTRYQLGKNAWWLETSRGPINLLHVRWKLDSWAPELRAKFLPLSWDGEEVHMPTPVISLEWKDRRVLGYYRRLNGLGLHWEIGVNPRHLAQSSEIDLAATLLHEQMHLFEHLVGKAPRSRNNYHSRWFRRTAEEIGTPCSLYGADLGIRPDSPFMAWAKERGLSGDPILQVPVEPLSVREPRRVPWRCQCPKHQSVQVLVARGSELRSVCQLCGATFCRETN